MSELRDIFTTRIIMSNMNTTNDKGEKVLIRYQVDVVSAFNNVPESKDYDPDVPIVSGSGFLVHYRMPTRDEECSFFSDKTLADRFIKQLADPNSDFYTK